MNPLKKSPDFLFVVHRLQHQGKIKPGGVDRIIDFILSQGLSAAVLENPLEGKGPLKLSWREKNKREEIGQIACPFGGPPRWIMEMLLTPNLANSHLTGDYTIICADPLNFIAARPLMRPGRKSIFLVVDYSPQRFSNRLFNFCYQKSFQSALDKADAVWTASKTARKLGQTMVADPHKIRWLPNSPYLSEVPRVDPQQRKITELVLMGHLSDSTNLELVAQALAKKELQNLGVTLTLIGPGKKQANIFRRWNVENKVAWLGLLPRIESLQAISQAGIGLAFYGGTPDLDQYRDSLKIREYAAAGIPVICDGITPTAREGEQRGACFIVNSAAQLAQTAKALITNSTHYEKSSQAAWDWAKDMDKGKILKHLFIQEGLIECVE